MSQFENDHFKTGDDPSGAAKNSDRDKLQLRVPESEEIMRPRLVVLGVGGAGGNAVNNMIQANLEGVDFVVANTDAQALRQSLAPSKIQLGGVLTEGLGAGADPETGRAAAEESMDELMSAIGNAHMVFLTAGMGGGTGTGAAPEIARELKDSGILTVGVITKPFDFEGIQRSKLAQTGIDQLSEQVDTLIVIPNQHLFRVASDKALFADAMKMADEVLYNGVRAVSELITGAGVWNLDFADVRTLMTGMGKALMGTGEADGEDRAIKAAEAAIRNPLLEDLDLASASGILINISAGEDLTFYEVEAAASRIRSEVPPEANILVGQTTNPSLKGKIRVSVVATGIDQADARKKNPAQSEATTIDQETVTADDSAPLVGTVSGELPSFEMTTKPAPAQSEQVQAPVAQENSSVADLPAHTQAASSRAPQAGSVEPTSEQSPVLSAAAEQTAHASTAQVETPVEAAEPVRSVAPQPVVSAPAEPATAPAPQPEQVQAAPAPVAAAAQPAHPMARHGEPASTPLTAPLSAPAADGASYAAPAPAPTMPTHRDLQAANEWRAAQSAPVAPTVAQTHQEDVAQASTQVSNDQMAAYEKALAEAREQAELAKMQAEQSLEREQAARQELELRNFERREPSFEPQAFAPAQQPLAQQPQPAHHMPTAATHNATASQAPMTDDMDPALSKADDTKGGFLGRIQNMVTQAAKPSGARAADSSRPFSPLRREQSVAPTQPSAPAPTSDVEMSMNAAHAHDQARREEARFEFAGNTAVQAELNSNPLSTRHVHTPTWQEERQPSHVSTAQSTVKPVIKSVSSTPNLVDEDDDLLADIPAFLRRQYN